MTTPLLKSESTGSIPYIPAQAPFSPEQRAWLNGYLAGMFSRALQDAPHGQPSASDSKSKATVHILYGSQSGTAEGIAKDLAKQAQSRGFDSVILELNDYQKMDRTQDQTALIVTSTWGDGEPPDNALKFWDDIQATNRDDWKKVSYSVLALGDSNYAEFCGAGKSFDERLHALGATRLHERVDCDVDYEEPTEQWTQHIWDILETKSKPPLPNTTDQVDDSTTIKASHAVDTQTVKETTYNRKHPFTAELILQKKLNQTDSAKDTRHVEINLEGSGLSYAAGDALGVFPSNDPQLVESLIQHCQMNAQAEIHSKDGKSKTLTEALISDCQITKINQRLLTELKTLQGLPTISDSMKLTEGMDLLDVIPGGADLDEQAFVDVLPKQQPRLHSIASSPLEHPDAIHLTVGVVRYEMMNRMRGGVCSTFLADRLSPSDKLPVFIHPSSFKLPEQTDQSIIYVQDRMRDQSSELWKWIEEGASFYVCGDAKRMAKDVDQTLHQIIASEGGMSTDQASAYVDQMKKEKRYQRDVY